MLSVNAPRAARLGMLEQGLGFSVSRLADSLNDATQTKFYYQNPTHKIMT